MDASKLSMLFALALSVTPIACQQSAPTVEGSGDESLAEEREDPGEAAPAATARGDGAPTSDETTPTSDDTSTSPASTTTDEASATGEDGADAAQNSEIDAREPKNLGIVKIGTPETCNIYLYVSPFEDSGPVEAALDSAFEARGWSRDEFPDTGVCLSAEHRLRTDDMTWLSGLVLERCDDETVVDAVWEPIDPAGFAERAPAMLDSLVGSAKVQAGLPAGCE